MAEHTANRRTLIKLMLARGYTWETIKTELEESENGYSQKQYRGDRQAIEKEVAASLTGEEPLEMFAEYKRTANQVIEDLQVAAENSDSTAGTVSALRGKEATAKNVIGVAQDLGILPKVADRVETQGTQNVTVRIEDKAELVDLITKHLTGSNE